MVDGSAAGVHEPRWYACYTRARHEKVVEAMLQERGIDAFLPLIERESIWKDRKRKVDWPMFPSYVFGRFDLASSTARVLSVPGVTSLVKLAAKPIAIGEDEIENVRRFAQALRDGGAVDPEPQPFFAEGEWVEIMSGPFEGVRGVVTEHRGRRRVRVGLKAIGQGMEITIDPAALRRMTAP